MSTFGRFGSIMISLIILRHQTPPALIPAGLLIQNLQSLIKDERILQGWARAPRPFSHLSSFQSNTGLLRAEHYN